MTETDVFAAFPPTLRAGTSRPDALYRRLPELVAIHGGAGAPADWEIVLALEDPPIVVCRGAVERWPDCPAEVTLTPVYALTRRGPPAVPTGLVLVRFDDGLAAASQADLLATAGFHIHQVLPYAPGAAWVKATSGDIPSALRGIPALEALAGVVEVEPQMVRRADRR